MTHIQAIIFDFDGLVADTETADFRSWQKLYADYDCTLPIDEWHQAIGSMDHWSPYEDLAERADRPLERDMLRKQQRVYLAEYLLGQQTLPGVTAWIEAAQTRGLRLAIASSSPHRWVEKYLPQFGLEGIFDPICCGDDVPKTKPDPAVYKLALEKMNIKSKQAIALEDSPNGVRAAQGAGIFSLAVPNRMTRDLFDKNGVKPDLTLRSLAAMTLDELLTQIEQR